MSAQHRQLANALLTWSGVSAERLRLQKIGEEALRQMTMTVQKAAFAMWVQSFKRGAYLRSFILRMQNVFDSTCLHPIL
jgi:hypothetical protein